jgi:hypothetical protein
MSECRLGTFPLKVISKQTEGKCERTADHHMAAAAGIPKIWKAVEEKEERLAGGAGRRQLPACMTLPGCGFGLVGPFVAASDCAKAE